MNPDTILQDFPKRYFILVGYLVVDKIARILT